MSLRRILDAARRVTLTPSKILCWVVIIEGYAELECHSAWRSLLAVEAVTSLSKGNPLGSV
jgi:hypothetical protein